MATKSATRIPGRKVRELRSDGFPKIFYEKYNVRILRTINK